LWHEAVQQAAKKAVSECDVLDVLIDGYDRWLSVEVHRDGDSESFRVREAHELHEEDEPTNEQYQQATKQAEHNWQVIRQVAEGEPLLIRWVNGEVDTSEMNRREWTPINARFTNPMLDEWRRSDDDNTTIAPQPWDIVTASVINEAHVPGLSKPVLAAYVDQVHFDDMGQSTTVSAELARLNSTDLNQRILQRLNAEFGADTIADLIGRIYPQQVEDDVAGGGTGKVDEDLKADCAERGKDVRTSNIDERRPIPKIDEHIANGIDELKETMKEIADAVKKPEKKKRNNPKKRGSAEGETRKIDLAVRHILDNPGAERISNSDLAKIVKCDPSILSKSENRRKLEVARARAKSNIGSARRGFGSEGAPDAIHEENWSKSDDNIQDTWDRQSGE
jgi:hypothetical protein